MTDPPPMLPSRKRFIADRAESENERGIEWTTSFDDRARFLLYNAFFGSFPHDPETEDLALNRVWEIVTSGTELRLSSPSFADASTGLFPCPDEEYLDWLAAASMALFDLAKTHNGFMSAEHEYAFKYDFQPATFIHKANDIMLERRIDYTFVEGVLRARGAEPLHIDVIQPLESLLTSNPRFSAAEAAYQDATTALATGNYGAAITSAGSALQQTFVTLGARGNDLGALHADARSRGFLHGHDEKLLQAFKNIGDWVTGDRSNRGIAHGAANAQHDDAALAIHIVAAVIVRLIQLGGVTSAAGGNSPESGLDGPKGSTATL